MRAGNLDRQIEIQHRTTALDDYGTPVETWSALATVRAQLLAFTIDDREGTRGSTTDTNVTFRLRWLDGVTLEHRVLYAGSTYTIRQVVELGRRNGLDLKCDRVGF